MDGLLSRHATDKIVLLTGDANLNNGQANFKRAVEHAIEAGMYVHQALKANFRLCVSSHFSSLLRRNVEVWAWNDG